MTNEELEQARQKKNEYYRAYKAKNKAKIKDINAKYWLNKSKQDKEVVAE